MTQQIDPYHRATLVRRLRRLLMIRRRRQEELNDLGFEFMDRCIEATIAECADVGAAGEAATLVRRYRPKRNET